jgi:UV DNA damage endonuclease
MPAESAVLRKVEHDDDLTPPPVEEEEAEEAVEEAVKEVVKLAERRKRGKPVSYVQENEDIQVEKRKRSRRKATAVYTDEADVSVAEPTPKKGRTKMIAPEDGERAEKPTPTLRKSRVAKDEPDYDSEGNEIVKKKRKPKVYPKIEYNIPPVERRETTFRGVSI